MRTKRVIGALFLMLVIFPSALIHAETNVNAVQDKILAVTPEWVSKPIITTIERLEEFREKNIVLAKEKKQEFNQEVALLNTSKFETQKFFAYAKLFLMTILTLILEQKVLFYGLLLILVATIFRFIWRKIF